MSFSLRSFFGAALCGVKNNIWFPVAVYIFPTAFRRFEGQEKGPGRPSPLVKPPHFLADDLEVNR